MSGSAWRVVSGSLRAAIEMALPTSCGGCGAPGPVWCARCAHEAGTTSYPGGPKQVCPTPCPVAYPPTWAATPYAGSVRVALVAFKDSDRRDLGTVLAPMLSDAMVAALTCDPRLRAALASGNGPVIVIPVPSSPSAVRRRGDAPLELLTHAAVACSAPPVRPVRQVRAPSPGRSSGDLVVWPALRIRRRVADQAGLNHRQRAANLEYAMQVKPRWRAGVRGVPCLLVDDVLTTGATLMEAARALREAGAGPIGAATVAATQRRAGPSDGGLRNEDLREQPVTSG